MDLVASFCSLDPSLIFLMVKAHLQNPSDRTDGQLVLTPAFFLGFFLGWPQSSWSCQTGRFLGSHAKRRPNWHLLLFRLVGAADMRHSFRTFLLIYDLLTSVCV